MIDRKSNRVRLGVIFCCMAVLASFNALSDATTNRVTTVSVYECTVEGRRTFSDQPCGPNAQPREIAESNRMAAQDTRILSRHETSTKAPQTADDDTDNKKAACNRLREQQKQVESQQRIGYTAKQGERLRERHDKLAERYASLKCERYR